MDRDLAGRLLVDHSRCLRCRLAESGCSSCREICPRDAVELSDGVGIRGGSCTGCLLCTTVCPTGALESSTDFEAILRDLAGIPRPVVGCGRSRFPVIHARLFCLGELSVEHLLSLVTLSAAVITLASDQCADCPAGGVIQHLAERIELVESMGEGFRNRLVREETPPPAPVETVSRRGFLSLFGSTLFRSARDAVPFRPVRSPSPARYADKVVPLRRRLLMEACTGADPDVRERVMDRFVAGVVIGEQCSLCMGCVAICPTGALSGGGDTPLRFDRVRCTGCGLCPLFCPDGAIGYSPADKHP